MVTNKSKKGARYHIYGHIQIIYQMFACHVTTINEYNLIILFSNSFPYYRFKFTSMEPLYGAYTCVGLKGSKHRFIYLGFYIAFSTVQVISRRVVGRAEETSTYNWSRFCSVNCRPTASNYQLSHLRSGWEPNPDLRGGRRECYHSATMAP